MTAITGSDWFYWALAVAIGLPLVLIVLTEVLNTLQRRDSPFASPVRMIRDLLVPGIALLLLLVKASEVSVEATGVRILASVVGLVALLLVLFGLRRTLFAGAPEDSWRKRIPSIFVDVARFALIVVGVGLIASYVWGANIGGLFTALGVTSIVIGLALQNAAGQIISGLLLLFEQPFRLGDWLETGSARGRVVEVNWRATHLETSAGLQIMPNSSLAESTFVNLSRPQARHSISVTTSFAGDDPPDVVCAMLSATAADLPQLRAGAAPTTVMTGPGEYSTTIPLRGPADDSAARTTFLRWSWYAARRAGVRFDEVGDEPSPEAVARATGQVARVLHLSAGARDCLGDGRLQRYGAGEVLQRAGVVPSAMLFVLRGTVRVTATGAQGEIVALPEIEGGDYLGQSTLTREPADTDARAVSEVTVFEVPQAAVDAITARDPGLRNELGRAIEGRREMVTRAVEGVARRRQHDAAPAER